MTHNTAITPVAPDDPERAQLFLAIRDGGAARVADIIARRPELVNTRGREGQTPLHVAAQYDDPELGALLLAHGADPEATLGDSGHTAMSWAVTCNAQAFARVLVKHGVTPDLFCAAGMGSLDDVRNLFDASGALVRHAARTGSTRLADDGTRLPCPPEATREQISDALCIACRNAQFDVTRFLLTKQPDLTFKAFMGATAFHWAYFGGSRAVIDLIANAGADAGVRDVALRCTPSAFGICTAANWGLAFLVRKQLAADPTRATVMDGRTSALHEAARGGSVEVAQMLIEHGADPASLDGDGRTPIDIATAAGHVDVVTLLRVL